MGLLDAFNNAPAGDRTLTSQVPLNTAPTVKSLALDDKLIIVVGAAAQALDGSPAADPSFSYDMGDNIFDNGGGDGIAGLTEGQLEGALLLLKHEVNPKYNGLWVYSLSGNLFTRSTIPLVKGMLFAPAYGAQGRGRVFQITTEDPIVVGTTPVTIAVTQSYGIALPIAQ